MTYMSMAYAMQAEDVKKKVEADKKDEIQTAVQKAMDLADFLL